MFNTAEERYGISFDEYKTVANPVGSDGEPLEIGVTEKGGVIYFKCPDFLDKTQIGIFPICDSFLDYSDIGNGVDLGGGILSRTEGMPKALVNLTKPLDDWIRSIKVPNTIKKGTRFNEAVQDVIVHSISNAEDFDRALSTMSNYIADKEKQYKLPVGFMAKDYGLTYRIMAHRGMKVQKVITLIGKVNTDLYAWLGFEVNGHVYAPFMWTTHDPELQKTYKPAIAAHVAMTQQCHNLGMHTVDYGSYYDYKNILAFDKVWVNGIAYR